MATVECIYITGILLGLAAAIFYSTVVIMNKRIIGIDAYQKTTVQLFSAGIVMIPYMLLKGGSGSAGFSMIENAGIIRVVTCEKLMAWQERREKIMGKMTKHEMADFFGVPYNTVVEAVLKLNNGRSTQKKDMTIDVEAVRAVLLAKYDVAMDRIADQLLAQVGSVINSYPAGNGIGKSGKPSLKIIQFEWSKLHARHLSLRRGEACDGQRRADDPAHGPGGPYTAIARRNEVTAFAK